MAGSCTTELDVPRESAVPETFYATIDDNTGHEATRTFTDESLLVRWSKEDHISVFNGNTAATEYAFAGEDGDLEGEFEICENGSADGTETGGAQAEGARSGGNLLKTAVPVLAGILLCAGAAALLFGKRRKKG